MQNISVSGTEESAKGELKPLFPTVLAATSLGIDETTRNEIAAYIRQNGPVFKKRARDGVIFEQSPMNLHHLPLMEPLFERIVFAVRGALKGIGIDPAYLNLHITRSWANYNVKSMVTSSHTHGNSHISIIYYPDDSSSQASINFMNINKQNEWIPGITETAYARIGVFDRSNYFSADFISYTPQADTCLIFPSNIVHSVSPNTSDRARISIAMDTLFTLKKYTRDEALLPPPSDWRELRL